MYEDRLATSRAAITLAEAAAASLVRPSTMVSKVPKGPTPRTLLSNDIRVDTVHDPYQEPLGPGTYWIEGGSPDIGPLPCDSPTRGASPCKDPNRESPAFLSPPRTPLWRSAEGGHLGAYLGADFKPLNDRAAEWFRSSSKRADVSDYRYGTRYKEALKEVPDVDYEPVVDKSSRAVPLALTASTKKAVAVPFMSREPRFAALPRERHNDSRLSKQRSDEDPTGLGPGSYGPYLSLGAAKRSTYRMFGPVTPPGIIGYGAGLGGGPGMSGGGSTPTSARNASPAFSGTQRGQKYGPFTWKTDSALTRSM
eukprot:CAMPEP_0202920702 /NCGR_PEP_ID=MMETSP1392-20130828/76996_1 /ASSEMBLY_ACC=CAM_ASM_000868 /TAXON_ID=225041 /ORGANISM="Chlamydomonas chlamydogama, Strain SAG 11-48b" /LENGTH=308 /DNA_ID=CAMNT_0049614211 /DNA_START=332 /DNA_END=1258 /DNA_ORIENTATION=+